MHLDVHTTEYSDDLARLLDLGATTILPERLENGTRWTVLADPEGNEFCLLMRAGKAQ